MVHQAQARHTLWKSCSWPIPPQHTQRNLDHAVPRERQHESLHNGGGSDHKDTALRRLRCVQQEATSIIWGCITLVAIAQIINTRVRIRLWDNRFMAIFYRIQWGFTKCEVSAMSTQKKILLVSKAAALKKTLLQDTTTVGYRQRKFEKQHIAISLLLT